MNHEQATTIDDLLMFLEKNMVTKEDALTFATKEDLAKMELKLLDAMDEKNAELKEDITVLVQKEDRKVVALLSSKR